MPPSESDEAVVWRRRRALLADAISGAAPDLLALQEVTALRADTADESRAHELAIALGLETRWPHFARPRRGPGVDAMLPHGPSPAESGGDVTALGVRILFNALALAASHRTGNVPRRAAGKA